MLEKVFRKPFLYSTVIAGSCQDVLRPRRQTDSQCPGLERLIQEAGVTLLFLPPYSPDFNPIEEAFPKVKGTLRKVQARTREALVEATGRALDTITRRDIRSFCSGCGYRSPLQSL